MNLDALRKPDQTIAPRLERIIKHGAATIQAIFDDAYGPLRLRESKFHDTRPARFERQTPARHRNDAPRKRIRIDHHVLHGFTLSQCLAGFGTSDIVYVRYFPSALGLEPNFVGAFVFPRPSKLREM